MATSKSIIIGFMILFLVAIVYNGYTLKTEFASIDAQDPYWEYDTTQALPSFSHIQILGGNSIYVKLVEGEVPALHTKSEIETPYTYTVDNDTLRVNFSPTLFSKRIAGKRWRNYRVVVSCPTIKSIKLHHAYADVVLKSKDSMAISAAGFSVLKLSWQQETAIKALQVALSGTAKMDFAKQEKPLKTGSLRVSLRDTSFVNLNQTVAQRFMPIVRDQAGIYYGKGKEHYENTKAPSVNK